MLLSNSVPYFTSFDNWFCEKIYFSVIMLCMKICSSVFLLLLVLLHSTLTVECHDDVVELVECKHEDLPHVFSKSGRLIGFEWLPSCRIFRGELNLNEFDLKKADFRNLEIIVGRLVMIGTNIRRFPAMPKLRKIKAVLGLSGLVILNNQELQDMRGLVSWEKNVKITGSDTPVFISGNPVLETVNYPKMFHTPYSPLLCEKRLTPNYDATFAEAQSLTVTLVALALVVTIFLYPLSMGDVIVYFVPNYHQS